MSESAGLVLRPTGALDAESCTELRQQLAAAFSAGVASIAVDLSRIGSVDLTGLRVLAGAARHVRRHGGLLVVTKAPSMVATMMRINGMAELLEIPASPRLRMVKGQGTSTERVRSLSVVRQDTGS